MNFLMGKIYKVDLELFKNTLVEINIIHPPAMKSKMRKKFPQMKGGMRSGVTT